MLAKDAGAETFRLTSDGFEVRFFPPVAEVQATPRGPRVEFPGQITVAGELGTEPVKATPTDNYSVLFGGNKPRLGTDKK